MGLSRPMQTQPTSQVIVMKLEKAIVIRSETVRVITCLILLLQSAMHSLKRNEPLRAFNIS